MEAGGGSYDAIYLIFLEAARRGEHLVVWRRVPLRCTQPVLIPQPTSLIIIQKATRSDV